jgi:hypothetical protein
MIDLDQDTGWREIDSPQANVPNVIFVMRFHISHAAIRIFELPVRERQ